MTQNNNTYNDNDDDIFLNEEEIKQINTRKPREAYNQIENDKDELKKTAGYIKIEYSSNGRFWIPPELHFRELNTKEIADLSSSSIDTLLENLIMVLKECVLEKEVNMEDMTPEEFLETLIALKLEYTVEHEHFFICENCSQEDFELEDIKPSTYKLDLTTLNYTEIEEADEKLKEYYRPILESFSKEEFNSYLIQRYKEDPLEDIDSWTLDKELETIKVKNEYSIPFDGKKYSFRWLKISDLVYAQKEVDKKYKPQIKKIIKEKYANMPYAEQKLLKKEKIDKIKESKNKDIAYYSLSMSLDKIDGKSLSLSEKLDKYKLPQSIANSIGEYLKTCEFGLSDKRVIVCDKCNHEQERWLQHSITFVELLPLNNVTKRRSATDKRNVILIGV